MSHYYNREGQLVPSYTDGAWPSPSTILDMIHDPESEGLRSYLGDEEYDRIMDEASARGTRVHKLCEDWIAGNYLEFEDVRDIDYFVGFQNWCELNQPVIIESERVVESKKYQYRGRLDLVIELNGELWVIDIKTGVDRARHGLQLKFYQQAYFEMTGSRARMGVLGLSSKNKCGYRRLKELREPLKYIVAAVELYKWRRKHNPVKVPVVEAEWKI